MGDWLTQLNIALGLPANRPLALLLFASVLAPSNRDEMSSASVGLSRAYAQLWRSVSSHSPVRLRHHQRGIPKHYSFAACWRDRHLRFCTHTLQSFGMFDIPQISNYPWQLVQKKAGDSLAVGYRGSVETTSLLPWDAALLGVA